MRRTIRNKTFIEATATIIVTIIVIAIILITIISMYILIKSEENGESNMHCYWTTKGVICGGKLGN